MTALDRLVRAWNQFWFAEGSTQSLGLLRIFYGITVVLKGTGLWGIKNFQSWRIQLPRNRVAPISELGDQLYRDPMPGFSWIPAISPDLWHTIEALALVAAVLWTVGLFTRISGICVWLYFIVPMLHSRFDYWHHSSNFAFFLMLLVFLPVGDHYSLDRFIFRSRQPDRPRTMMSVRMVQVLLTWVYISTLCGKFNAEWFDGTIMQIMQDRGMFKGPIYPYIMSVVNAHILSIYTLAAQIGFFVLVFTRYRRWALFFGANLHLGIDMLMNVTTFSYQMISLYICFINPWSRQTAVYYDGQSSRQRMWVQIGRLLNWFDRIDWRDYRSHAELSDQARETMVRDGGMIFQSADGRQLTGLSAAREITERLPLTFLPSFALEVALWFMPTRVRSSATTTKD